MLRNSLNTLSAISGRFSTKPISVQQYHKEEECHKTAPRAVSSAGLDPSDVDQTVYDLWPASDVDVEEGTQYCYTFVLAKSEQQMLWPDRRDDWTTWSLIADEQALRAV